MIELLNVNGYSLEVSNTLATRKKGRILAYVKNGENLRCKTELERDFNDILAFENQSGVLFVGVYNGFKLYEGETQGSNTERLLLNLKEICGSNEK